MLGSMAWYGAGAPWELGGGENREWVGERSLSTGSCFGDIKDGEEEAELSELSEERFSSEEIGEKADFSVACLWLCRRWAW